MIAIPRYRFREKLCETGKTVIYRGTRDADGLPVLAKFLKKPFPSEVEQEWLAYTFRILGELTDLPGVVTVVELVDAGHGKTLIIEDFGAVSLRELIPAGGMETGTFLTIATGAAAAVGGIHHRRVIHRDLNPDHLLVNRQTLGVRLTGFGMATRIAPGAPGHLWPERLEGSLAHISPEQTGRMNRSVDFRADFYALGVTFYEMLTGKLPFEATDPAELLHAHMALKPVAPFRVNAKIPAAVSGIVMKLLEKAPEDRYQSAAGLCADLALCSEGLTAGRDIASFELAKNDLPEQFLLPEKLYGRQEESEVLFEAFRKISAGDLRMLLIEGPPGIGKTFLIRELEKKLVGRKGYITSGKFDQLRDNTPYAPMLRAFRSLIRQILTCPAHALERWKERLAGALSPNGRLMVELIPELSQVIGKQPEVPVVDLVSARNRFKRTFLAFIRVFADRAHPLVLIIDDWQWADAATLDLLSAIARATDIRHLLFIGVYRDTEVSANHPFRMLMEDIRKGQKREIVTMSLSPLALPHVVRFVRDTLHCTEEAAAPLAKLVFEKTGGNPFFIRQFLQSLHDEKLLSFDRAKRAWRWRLSEASAMAATENVVALMIGRFRRLDGQSRRVLQLAACIGNRFDLETLSALCEASREGTFARLGEAVEKGYLLPEGDNYEPRWGGGGPEWPVDAAFRFAHDRIQQAAYSLLAPDDRLPVHLAVGRRLAETLENKGNDDKIFEAADHLNRARALIGRRRERIRLAELNLAAGLKAKKAAAYAPAADYLEKGSAILSDRDWSENYALMRDLHRERAEVEYLVGRFERSSALIEALLSKVLTDLEKAEVLNLLIVQETMSARYGEAIAAGRKALFLVGVALPESDAAAAFEGEIAHARKKMAGRNIADLVNGAEMTGRTRRLRVRILTNICSAAYRSDQALFRLLVVKAVNACLDHGLVVESCYGFSAYGLLLGATFGDYKSGYEFGMLALGISERFGSPPQKCRAYFVLSSTLVHWVRHAKEADAASDACYDVGLDSGEFQFAGYILTYKLSNRIFLGQSLARLMESAHRYLAFGKRTRNRWAIDVILGAQLVLENLAGKTASAEIFACEGLEEARYLSECRQNESFSALCRYHIFKAQALYLFGRFAEAENAIRAAGGRIAYIYGTIFTAEYNFMDSLLQLRLCEGASEKTRSKRVARIRENQRQMERWAENCPENFRHRYLLVAAETEKVAGDVLAAVELYDQAIAAAAENGYVQVEAMANEGAANLWLSRQKPDFAAIHLRRAYRCYGRWGAKRKQALLAELHPDLCGGRKETDKKQETSSLRGEVTLERLEMDAVIRALRAISGEIVLSRLLSKLMAIVVMEAGADRGALFLAREEGLFLSAEIRAQEMETQLSEIPLDESVVPHSVIRFVARTRETVVMGSAPGDPLFDSDPYIAGDGPKSVLCMPVVRQRQLKAVLYVENRSASGAFTPERQKVLRLLGAQMAISLENALLFDEIRQEVAERRRAEAALRESEERFREMADLLPQTIYEADLEGKLTYLNRSGFSAFGYGANELEKGVAVRDVVVPEDRLRLDENIAAILAGEALRGNAYTLQGKEGASFPVIAYSSRIIEGGDTRGVRGIIIDVTELRQAESEVVSTRNYLRNLFDTLPSALVSVDGRERIRQWNTAAETLTGLSASAVIGGRLWDVMPFLSPYRKPLAQMFDSGRGFSRHREPLFSGKKRCFDLFFHPLASEGSFGAVIRVDDVTEAVGKDQQLLQAQKMETIGNLAGGLAHDFNNLLAAITGTLSLMRFGLSRKGGIVPEKLTSYVELMENASDRAVEMVRRLLTLSRKRELSLSRFNLNDAVNNVLKICRNTVDKSVDIREHYDEENAMIAADLGQIEQMLLNVCVNAAHAMTIMRGADENPGGTLSVSVEKFTADSFFCASHPGAVPGPYWILKVRDTGVGMSRKTLLRIFDPFFTTKEKGSGSGLGLSMAYSIVKQHKGLIDVVSEPGTGATFNIFLPAAEQKEKTEAPAVPAVEIPTGFGVILVVDDEEVIRLTAKGILEAAGYEVILAEGGVSGVRLFSENRERIDGVLLDMAMPEKSGKEVFSEIKAMDPDVRVLITSGFRQDERVRQTLEMGASDFLQKPWSMAQLIRSVRRVIDG